MIDYGDFKKWFKANGGLKKAFYLDMPADDRGNQPILHKSQILFLNEREGVVIDREGTRIGDATDFDLKKSEDLEKDLGQYGVAEKERGKDTTGYRYDLKTDLAPMIKWAVEKSLESALEKMYKKGNMKKMGDHGDMDYDDKDDKDDDDKDNDKKENPFMSKMKKMKKMDKSETAFYEFIDNAVQKSLEKAAQEMSKDEVEHLKDIAMTPKSGTGKVGTAPMSKSEGEVEITKEQALEVLNARGLELQKSMQEQDVEIKGIKAQMLEFLGTPEKVKTDFGKSQPTAVEDAGTLLSKAQDDSRIGPVDMAKIESAVKSRQPVPDRYLKILQTPDPMAAAA